MNDNSNNVTHAHSYVKMESMNCKVFMHKVFIHATPQKAHY